MEKSSATKCESCLKVFRPGEVVYFDEIGDVTVCGSCRSTDAFFFVHDWTLCIIPSST